MSGTIPTIGSLVDQSKMKTAHDAVIALGNRLKTAEAALKTAADAVDSAKAAVQADVVSAAQGNSVDPTANQAALAAAQQKYDFALSLVTELESQVATAHAAKIEAQGAAFKPVFDEGVKLRVQAAQQADAARASLKAAKELSAKGAAFIQAAWENRYPRNDVDGAVLYPREVRTADDEAAIWGVSP